MRLSTACAVATCAAIATGGMAATSLAASGGIETVAGTGTAGSLSTGLATTSRLDTPSDVLAMPDGGFLVADTANGRIRAVSAAGAVSTLAGGETASTTGRLAGPLGLALAGDGGVLVSDGDRVVRILAGTLSRVAGDGSPGAGGDGGAALSARLDTPAGLAALPSGGFVVADMGNHRIRKVENGRITTVAGRGTAGSSGDGGRAVDAELRTPTDVAVLHDGDLLIADMGNDRVRRVDDATGVISTVAGGVRDGAELPEPRSVAPAGDGFAVSVAGAHQVRHVAADGTITAIAGTGTAGSGGDGGPGTAAQLHAPSGLSVTARGQLLIADRAEHRIRSLDAGLPAAGGLPVSWQAPFPSGQTGSGGQPLSSGGDPAPDEETESGKQPASGGDPSPDEETESGKQPGTGEQPSPVAPAPVDPALITPEPGPTPAPSPAAPGGDGTSSPEAPVAPAGSPVGSTSDPVAPELGRMVVVAPVSGIVLVRRAGARTATPLGPGEEIPVGSLVDARRGTVALTSALPGGRTQTGRFSGGRFSITQPAGAKGMTELTLRGPELGSCRPTSPGKARAAARRKPARRLWGQDEGGRFRTRGRNSVATVRGTRWLTEDTCAGTRTRVLEGAVDVFDPRRGITRRVGAGASLLVRPVSR